LLTGLLQPTHLILVLIVALLFLGPKRLPEAGRAMGHGLREFKNSVTGAEHEAELPASADPVPDHKLTNAASSPSAGPARDNPTADATQP
jgi:sec-independent protein translocase protein TatA